METIAKAAPDGYTMVIASASEIINQHAFKEACYDIAKDFAPVSLTGSLPLVLAVTNSLPAKSVDQLVELAKSKPGQLNYAAVVGASPHLMGELLKSARGIDIVMIPYKTSNDATADVASGRVEIMFTTVTAALALAKAGKVRILAVTGEKRAAVLPDVPTLAEVGLPAVDVSVGYFILVPARTPKPIVNALNSEIVKAIATKEVRERLAAAGVEPKSSSPEELDALLKVEVARWGKIVTDLGIRVQ
jgi:tripartite-type tricarboxylate transporter receptor subunit TctC